MNFDCITNLIGVFYYIPLLCVSLCVCAVSSVRVIMFKDIASYSDFSV